MSVKIINNGNSDKKQDSVRWNYRELSGQKSRILPYSETVKIKAKYK